MRLFALLLLAFLGLTTAHDESFEQFWLNDVAFTEKLLRQHARDKMVGTPFHEFPEEPSRRTKRAVGADSCPAGYTGTFCESPMCTEKVDIVGHDIRNTVVEKKLASACSEPITIYVDSHLFFFRVSVQTSSQTRPAGQLYDPKGNKVDADMDKLQGTIHVYNYFDLIVNHGPGVYTFSPTSTNDDDCYITAISATPMVVYGGFIESQFSDKVQEDVPTGDDVQTNPTQQIPSYFGFMTTNTTTNDVPMYVSFHRGQDVKEQFAPLPVRPRYNCNADKFVGPYTCLDTGSYLLKVKGVDNSGNIWQRVYNFDCAPNPNIPPSNTSTPSPQLCQNGGTLIKQSDRNVCFCGAHFTGPDCGIKVCENGGTLGLQGDCVCPDGYSGRFCQHIACTKRERNFNTDKRGLTFVVRANSNDQVKTQIQRSAARIIAYFDDIGVGSFEEYALVMIVNGATIALHTYEDQDDFISDIANNENLWQTSTECVDKVFLGLLEALSLSTNTKYLRSPVFIFTDALSNDDDSTFADLNGFLSAYKSPTVTIFYGGGTDQCDIKTTADKYQYYQYLAQYTGGLTVRTDTTGDSISDAAYSIAVGIFGYSVLTGHDLVDSCQYAPDYHLFFVDESINAVVVAASGPVKIRVIDTNNNTLTSTASLDIGDLHLENYKSPAKGHYMLVIDSGGQLAPCSYRAYGRTNYEAYLGATLSVNTDIFYYQPLYNFDMHLVGTINKVDFPDPENLFAEVVVWQEDQTSLAKDRRKVVYASSGVYRDGCAYNLYFGQWKCTQRSQIFYANMYVNDGTGFTVMRTIVGQCANAGGNIQTGCRNGGVRYKDGCICTAGWEGDSCQKAFCYNGGTSRGDYCDCLVGYGGLHCQLNRCPNMNTNANFEPRGITVSLIVQNSKDLVGPLIKMGQVAPKIVNNLQSTHKRWVGMYTFWEFDDKEFDYVTKSQFSDELISEISDFTANRRTKKLLCDNLLVLDVLIAALSDPDASNNMEVFLYVNGGMVLDTVKMGKLFKLIDQLEAKIHVVQSQITNCYDPDDDHITTIAGISYYSGGTYSASGDGGSLLSLPLKYKSGNVFDEVRDACTASQVFYFPVESETQTISLYVFGDLKGDPTFIPPGRMDNSPIKVYSGLTDRLYVSMRECPDGWNRFEEHCFRMDPANGDTRMSSWSDAKVNCAIAGGTLATVDTKGLNDFLASSTGGFKAWIGLNDLRKKGTWEWDEGLGSPIPWDPSTSYNGFPGKGSPDQNKGDCVVLTSSGWAVDDCSKKYSYVCSKHAFNVNYDPGSNQEGHLPRGLWSVSFDVYTDDPIPCGVRVDAQSGLQIFRRYASSPFLDDGAGQATYNSANNYQLVHVASTLDEIFVRSSLEYAHFYTTNTPDMVTVSRMTRRENCAYEYGSSPFNAQQFAYLVAYTGFDAYGYPYQRLMPSVAFDNSVSCTNGGVKAKDENRCVCPPSWTGKECSEPLCSAGTIAPNDVSCRCYAGYVGDLCDTPTCLRGTGIEPPPITNNNKTFTLIIDGSFTGYNGKFLTDFKKVLDRALGDLQAVEGLWFKNYAAVIAYDRSRGPGSVSDVISKRGRADFETAVITALQEQYKSAVQERSFMRALNRLVNSNQVEIGSPIYIITDSAIADPDSFTESIYNLIAQKHLTISTIILGDTKVPGGKSSYGDPSVEPYLRLSYATGGGFYQVADSDSLAGFWTSQLASYFSSISLSHDFHRKCSDKNNYFQIGGDDTSVIIDIWSPQPQTITLFDSDGNQVSVTGVHSSNTNFLFSLAATKPGVWRLHITHTAKTDTCVVAVRAVRNNAPAVGFNTDVGVDRGLHSQGAGYAPVAGDKANSIIAYSSKDRLFAVNVYARDTKSLVFVSPLIRRTDDCKWNYVSKYLFTCPDSSFTVSIEGIDLAGHHFRRLYKTHCVNFFKT